MGEVGAVEGVAAGTDEVEDTAKQVGLPLVHSGSRLNLAGFSFR